MKKRSALVIAVLSMLTAPAHAQTVEKKPPAPPTTTAPPAKPAPPTAPPAKPAPPARPAPVLAHASAILHVASEIAQGIGQVPAGAVVVASAIASDVPAPKADELAVRIAAQVAGRLGGANAHPQPAALPVARGLSGRAASLLYLQLEIAKGELRVTADLYPVVSNGWERLRNPAPGPRAHAFATAPLDAEIRGFLTPVLLEQAAVHRIKHEEGEILAIGCGDVDGDGGLELVVVTRARVAIAKVRGGKLVVQRAATWTSIASRSPVPMREPLASVLVSPRGHRGEIIVGTTDRGGVVLDGSLVTRRVLSGLPVPGGGGDACTTPVADASAFEGNVVACDLPPVASAMGTNAGGKAAVTNTRSSAAKIEPLVLFVPAAPRYDAIAAVDSVARDGSVAQIVAVREPGGKLRVRRQDEGGARPIEATMEGTGAQLALVDLDLDGIPEIVTSADSGDDLVLVSTFAKGQITPRLRFPAKDGVRAIGVCPPEEKGVPGLVAVVGSEVWLVR